MFKALSYNSYYSRVFYSLIIIALIAGLHYSHILVLLDKWAFSGFTQGVAPQTTQAKVLMVEADQQARFAGDDVWLTLLNELQSNGAKQVVFSFTPEKVSAKFYCAAQKWGAVVFAQSVFYDENSDSNRLTALPEVSRPCLPSHVGVVDLPPHVYGSYYDQYPYLTLNGHQYPSLEFVAAQQVLKQDTPQLNKTYRLDFSRDLSRYPRVSVTRVLKGGLVGAFVQDRSVLVGFEQVLHAPALHTPMKTKNDNMLSMLEYHALALNTLLNQSMITEWPKWTLWLILAAQIVLSILAYNFFRIQQGTLVTLLFLAFYLALTAVAYHYFSLWLPVVEMLLCQLLLFWIVFKRKIVQADIALRKMLMETTFQLEERLSQNLITEEDHWSQVIVMVNQMLDLKRQIFLESLPNDHRVKEIKALNCSLDDIDERRRDYERRPYSTAIKENRALHLHKPFLKVIADQEHTEEQYLVPLVYAGDVLGFWAFGLDTEKYRKNPIVESSIKDFADQIAELLYRQQQWLLRNQADENALQRYLGIEGGDLAYKALNKSIVGLERQMNQMEDVLNGLDTATILYDLFGRVLQVNQRMLALTQSLDINPTKMTARDFIMAATQVDVDTARQFLRYTILEQGKMVLPVVCQNNREKRSYVLNLRPFRYRDQKLSPEQEAENQVETKLHLQGVLCEVADITEMKNLHNLKEEVAERLIFQLRNDFESIMVAMSLLTNDKLTAEKRQPIANIVQSKINDAVTILEQTQQHLGVNMDPSAIENYPVDGKKPVMNAVAMLYDKAEERRVKLQPELPWLISLVFAAPAELDEVIMGILTLLLHDALEDSTVRIIMEERNRKVTYLFKNTGFGIPNARLQQYLDKETSTGTDEFSKIRMARRLVQSWGGQLEARSAVGKGIHVILSLKSFI